MARGVEIVKDEPGGGPEAVRGSRVRIVYTARLRRGDVFRENHEVTFQLGGRDVIAGLEYGVEGMRVGGKRQIRIPPHLGFRERGIPGLVPPNALLLFDVELIGVE
jgi:FKBP-type peptidyl-prolyl cis-trans isomerase